MKANYADSAARTRRLVEERYRWMDAYKVRHGCQQCGYDEDPRALDWDHEDPETKTGNVSRMIRYASWEQVLAEIAKCTLLCANCHRIKTFSAERRRPAPSTEAASGPCDEI